MTHAQPHSRGASCSWHAEVPARWNCTQCHKLYCQNCAPKPPLNLGETKCALCHRALKDLGSSQASIPFWQRLNDFFIYPFRTQTMTFLFVTSLLGVTLSSTSVFTALMSLVLAACITKYTYKIIESMSDGRWEPPGVVEAFTGEGFHLFFKQLAVFIVMAAALAATAFFGGFLLFIGAAVFMALALPASVMVLAREDSLLDAIHPGKLLGVMTAIGWPYLLLFFFIILLYGGSGAFLAVLGSKISPNLLYPLSLFSSSYFTCVMCAMMGYCLYQYQDDLGYVSDSQQDSDEIDEDSWHYQKALADSSIYFQEGRTTDCADALKTGLSRRKKDPELSRRLFELRAIGSDKELMAQTTENYLQMLADKSQFNAAADALTTIRNRAPGWRPESPESLYNAARGLFARRSFKDVVLLLKDLHIRSPEYRKIPQAYLLMARALSEGLQRDVQALKVLRFIEKNFPDNKCSKDIQELTTILEGSSQKTAQAAPA